MSEFIRVEVDDRVAVVRLDRPQARNAISRAMHRELDSALTALDADDQVAAIVLTGTDPAFCGGVDIKELRARPEVAADIGPRRRPLFLLSTPLIGAVNGPAFTGGLELALGCDWLVASERAVFADTHARLGLTPGWGLTVLLAEAVGVRRARQMVTTCEPIDAATALQWGLVNEVVPHHELLGRALAHARAVAAGDENAVSTVLGTLTHQRAHIDAPLWLLEAAGFIDPAAVGPEREG